MNENTPEVLDNAWFQEHCFGDVNTEQFREMSMALTASYDQRWCQPTNGYPGVPVQRLFFAPPVPANTVAIPDHSSVLDVTAPIMSQRHLHPTTTSNGITHVSQPGAHMDQYSNWGLWMPLSTSQIESPRLEVNVHEMCRINCSPEIFLQSGSAAQCPSYPTPSSPGESSAQGYSPATSSESQEDGHDVAQECLEAWKKLPLDAVIVTGSRMFVPQKLYKPPTQRYIEGVTLSPPIIFLTEGPSEWGIPLVDALNGELRRLLGKDDLVLEDCGPSVSIRIDWPGYSSFKRYIPSRNFRKKKGPITKGRLAKNLATTTHQFIQKMSGKAMEDGADAKWKVGSLHIKVEDLILVSLHHVSQGSWQPQFRMRQMMPNQITHHQLLRRR
ncbi:hypothetical protein PAXRUDRAFT_598813 [Paxillus rubicundulus Ve08.2h10]|uniref:Uncharacterized protein n=1 Tax=Paxillus rubicundulus Ve08.2h10 TaxID=930991 RepID=A0A0D0EAW1_9AGAM|nr:hypothetical protein PAXRUDRAFT_598813 [Paxillus rubicundulus Ve08.2h10]